MTMAKKNKDDKMQALIKSDNAIIRELRDQKWIYNPKVFAQVAGDFSLMHQRVLLGVLEKLQDRIAYSASEHQKNQQLWLPLFSPDEMNTSVDFEIDPRDIGVTPGHYPELAQALSDLIGLKMGWPKRKGNKTVYQFVSFFSRLEMPMTESGWRTGKIRVKMDKENVNDFLSMERGYTDHIAKIAQFSKKQRTPRLYIYLSTFKYKKRDEVEYPELCEFLGIDDDSYVESHKAENPNVKPTDNPFHKFSKVKKLILDPSKQEMDKFSAEKKIDFTFTYEPMYKDGRKKGNPTHIEFVIVPGPLGIEREQDRKRHGQVQSVISSLTKWCRDIKPYEVVELAKEVQDDWLDDFCNFAYDDVRYQVEKTQPDHVAEYVITMLSNWIKDRQMAAERKRIEDQRQYELFQEQENEQRWRDTMAELPLTSRDIAFESYNKETHQLVVRLAREELYTQLDFRRDPNTGKLYPGEYTQVWFNAIRKHFGNDVKPGYRMPPKPKPER